MLATLESAILLLLLYHMELARKEMHSVPPWQLRIGASQEPQALVRFSGGNSTDPPSLSTGLAPLGLIQCRSQPVSGGLTCTSKNLLITWGKWPKVQEGFGGLWEELLVLGGKNSNPLGHCTRGPLRANHDSQILVSTEGPWTEPLQIARPDYILINIGGEGNPDVI